MLPEHGLGFPLAVHQVDGRVAFDAAIPAFEVLLVAVRRQAAHRVDDGPDRHVFTADARR